jgi:hypothetical protein
VWAHDYWLAQEPRALEPGDACSLRLLVGDELKPELERPLQKELTTRYEWHAPDGVMDLLETLADSTLPVFQRPVSQRGTFLVVMDRKFVPTEGTVEQFLQFLEHEEQPDRAAGYRNVDPTSPLRRRYARSIKALVRVGENSDGELHAKSIGQQIEIRMLQNPHTAALGAKLPVQVQYEGRNLSGQLVKALVQGDDGSVSVARATTDDEGVAHFELDRSGQWMLRVTYLQRCSESEEADWDTFYATFGFVFP